MLRRAMMAGGSGSPTGSFADLVLSHGPAMYLRLNDASGATAKGYGTPDGSYTNMIFGGEPLYPAGGTSVSLGAPNASIKWDANTYLPTSMPAMTLGTMHLGAGESTLRHLISRDGDSGLRYWQFRRSGANIEYIRIKGAVNTVSRPLAGTSGPQLYIVTVAADGGVSIYQNGSPLGAIGNVGAVDYGGTGRIITTGNRDAANEAAVGDRFSEAFVIPKALTAAEVAALAAAAGFA